MGRESRAKRHGLEPAAVYESWPDNDPCDEWPRDLIFKAVGLRGSCGHPKGRSECSYCVAGYPIGSTRPAWRRP